MKIESIVASAAIAMTAMVSPAVADGDTGSKEVRGFSVLSRVSADRLTDQEMSGLHGANVLFVITDGADILFLLLGDAVTTRICGSSMGCFVDKAGPGAGIPPGGI